ncbi:MAG TPA: hypothetical protein VFU17_11045 [Candidatus Limnocylindrales bacterium]|nr:hypothetical protein [Candidatus Limnocylindrales bacterium]
MNENEFARTARAWLDDGPTRMSDRAVLSALEEIHVTHQRRRPWWPARRATPVNIYARAAIAAIVVVSVGLVAINVLPRGSDGSGVGGQPTASQLASASPAVGIPELTQTFVSPMNGFSIGYADDATFDPAKPASDPSVEEGFAGIDFLSGPTYSLRAASAEVPEATSIDAWFDRETGFKPGDPCGGPHGELPEITIDGRSARISTDCPGQIEATVAVGRRAYRFTLYSEASDARAIFDAYASTIDLRPEEAASPPPS